MSCRICPPGVERAPLPDSYSCSPCKDDLAKTLDDIEALLPTLASLLRPGRVVSDQPMRRTKVVGSPAPLRIDVLSMMDDRNQKSPENVVIAWAKQFNVEPTCSALKNALDQIVESDRLVPFARDIRQARQALVLICGPRVTNQPPRKVATCQRDVRGRMCGGPIVTAPRSDTANCQRCGDEWPRSRWQMLGRLQDSA